MKNFAIILLGIVASCLAVSCIKPDCSIKYKFLIPATTSNYKDTLHIGDTLWFTIAIPNTLVNQNDGSVVDVTTMNYSAIAGFAGIDASPDYEATPMFKIIQNKGYLKNFGNGLRLVCTHEGAAQIARFAAIPQRVGVYTFSIQQEIRADEPLHGVKIVDNNCVQYLETEFAMNNKAENHFYLYQNSPDSTVKATTRHEFDYGGKYAFIVK
jgi:hypothetical protein